MIFISLTECFYLLLCVLRYIDRLYFYCQNAKREVATCHTLFRYVRQRHNNSFYRQSNQKHPRRLIKTPLIKNKSAWSRCVFNKRRPLLHKLRVNRSKLKVARRSNVLRFRKTEKTSEKKVSLTVPLSVRNGSYSILHHILDKALT